MLMVGAGLCWSASSGVAQSSPARETASCQMISMMGRWGLFCSAFCIIFWGLCFGFIVLFMLFRVGVGFPIRWDGW